MEAKFARYGIGLDVGIASVGWSVVLLNVEGDPCAIIGKGVRKFQANEVPKSKKTKAQERREARSSRRQLRRKHERKERIRRFIVREGIMEKEALTHLFDKATNEDGQDIYEIRTMALDKLVSDEDLTRIMIHLAKHRGYKSNRKVDDIIAISEKNNAADSADEGDEAKNEKKDKKKMLSAIGDNEVRMTTGKYRTVGEMLYKDDAFAYSKRNSGGEYKAVVRREHIIEEAHKIFEAQRALGNPHASEKIEDEYIDILSSQRSYDFGPGKNSDDERYRSPYAPKDGQNLIQGMLGRCTYDKMELRAAKATYSFEVYNLLQTIGNIRLVSDKDGTYPLTAEQRVAIYNLAFTPHEKEISYTNIREVLNLGDDVKFNLVPYSDAKTNRSAESKVKFKQLVAYHAIRKAFEADAPGRFEELAEDQLNAIGETVAWYGTDDSIRDELRKKDVGLTDKDIEIALKLSLPKGTARVSVKSCKVLNEYMLNGDDLTTACEKAGFPKVYGNGEKMTYLPPIDDRTLRDEITSPVAIRAITQTRKVINAIIERMGGQSPTYINIEVGRDVTKPKEERDKIRKQQDGNRDANDKAYKALAAALAKAKIDRKPNAKDITKYKLWEEQQHICPYSGKEIMLSDLLNEKVVEIDHIVPYSISWDNTFKNKVVVFAKENQAKGNCLPLAYLKGEKRDNFIKFVKENPAYKPVKVKGKKATTITKRDLLLRERLSECDLAEYNDRNLTDTRTASIFVKNYVEKALEFSPFPDKDKKQHVFVLNGNATSYIRANWGIKKNRDMDGDLHHAIDAIVIACATPTMIQQISRYCEQHELYKTEDGSISRDMNPTAPVFPEPWERFKYEVEIHSGTGIIRALKNAGFPYVEYVWPEERVAVSRMERHKNTGTATKETIYGFLKDDDGNIVEGKTVKKYALSDLVLDDVGLVMKTCKGANAYLERDKDPALYDAIHARLVETMEKNKAEKKKPNQWFKGAFDEPLRKPSKNIENAPIVKTVRLVESRNNIIERTQQNSDGETVRYGAVEYGETLRIDVFYSEENGYSYTCVRANDIVKNTIPKPEDKDAEFMFSLYKDDLCMIQFKGNDELELREIQKHKDAAGNEYRRTRKAEKNELFYLQCARSNGQLMFESIDGIYETYKVVGKIAKDRDAFKRVRVDVLGGLHYDD